MVLMSFSVFAAYFYIDNKSTIVTRVNFCITVSEVNFLGFLLYQSIPFKIDYPKSHNLIIEH